MSNSSSGNPLDNACDDINNCRQISDIVYGCLGTIFACVWVAVHRNVPRVSEPEIPRKVAIFACVRVSEPDISWKSVREWFEAQGESIGVTLVALAAPEFLVLWAARQWMTAKLIAAELQQLSKTDEHSGHDDRRRTLPELSLYHYAILLTGAY